MPIQFLDVKLLVFGRKQIVRPEVLDLSRVVGDSAKMLRRLVSEHIRLRTILPGGLSAVWADASQIGQVLLNLVLNARDAMPDGGELTIETANVDLDEAYAASHIGAKAGPHVRLNVTHTGCGMDEETRRRLFEPFFTTKPIGKGSGLGLAVVYGIVEQAGGHITVDSEPGRGTTVAVVLPATDASAGAGQLAYEKPVAEPLTGEGTILVCEDEKVVREPLCVVLEANGFKVLAAENGRHALEVAAGHAGPIHVLITDVVMPEMNGRDLATALRQRYPGLRVVYVSGYAADALGTREKLEDGARFIEKPYMVSKLLQHMFELLSA